jgi:adenylosuccinate lyase
VERIILPDATSLIDYMLDRYAKVLDELVVDEYRMLDDIGLTNGVVFSQRVLTLLLDIGVSRETAYDHIQSLTKTALDRHVAFAGLCLEDPWMTTILSKTEIESAFTLTHYLKHVDYIYAQVFGVMYDEQTI